MVLICVLYFSIGLLDSGRFIFNVLTSVFVSYMLVFRGLGNLYGIMIISFQRNCIFWKKAFGEIAFWESKFWVNSTTHPFDSGCEIMIFGRQMIVATGTVLNFSGLD